MKVIAVALSLLAAAGSTAAVSSVERGLQTCAVPSANVPCTLEEAPVKCGLSACEYGNQCQANAAGYAPSRCWPATCLPPADDAVCTFISNPVACGDLRCEYSNYCVAEAAGFPPTSCIAQNCPAPPANVACSLEYDPFICFAEGTGLCEYSNGCYATQSGFDPSETAGQCVRIVEIPANPPTCPMVPAVTDCEFEYDPMRCNGNCYYTNGCEATASGLDISDPLTCQSANCALPDPETICTADFAPVRCNPEGCQYSNQCTANAAGYDESSCVPAECAIPDPAVQCTREYNPQTCESNGVSCEYDNPCVAGAAGATNCVGLDDPPNPPECPVPPSDVVCTLDYDEKLCGDDDCFYPNQCLADEAGFSPFQCRSPNCPRPDVALGDCEDFDIETIRCGPYNCPYASRCLGNRAGWVPAECSPVGCPEAPAGTACNLVYDPIICYDSATFEFGCSFSNPCLAEAAGYDTSPYSGECVQPSLLTPTRAVSFELQDDMTATDATDGPEMTDMPMDTTDMPMTDETSTPDDMMTDTPDDTTVTDSPAGTPATDSPEATDSPAEVTSAPGALESGAATLWWTACGSLISLALATAVVMM